MPFWLTAANAFVYRRTTRGEHQFILVDAATGVKQLAFDQARLAAALNKASHKSYQADDLPFDRFELTDHGRRLDFLIEQVRRSCDLASYACTSTTLDVDAGASAMESWCENGGYCLWPPQGRPPKSCNWPLIAQ
ncbi:hypothetical protein [Mesorhizobium sp. AR07]|uniref:hypothetical protein n=1 Tax=Mesorhizobium sp. AR07 TaxID=2865838 RepID=UPI002160B872|nr:hypothetical protein [Mesorhizobium sp. AR07]